MSLALRAGQAGAAPQTPVAPPGPEWLASAPTPGPGMNFVTLEAMIAAVRADAALRTGTPAAVPEVLSATQVTWPDGSLGCAQPGMRYTMALVSGYQIVVRAQGQTFDYHASQRGGLLLCPAARSSKPLPGGPI